ncbi:putative gamma-glutamylcyclotransferase CG2811 isoform X2 [Palaemon carinicauda]|uniref:putative gamma-glutamylcyclotransferase CG2811 isoform X2 n=1 Tax=Palaemon carinicauda TaxID=392227 RepID=UPI0035B5D3AC
MMLPWLRCSRIMPRHSVFVYGTLKRGEPNHHWLTEKENGDALFVGTANTKEKYPLVIASRYNIPYTLELPGKGENIEGEIYDVDDNMLAKLDVLEDHPKYYERKVKKAVLQDSGEEVDIWIYLLHHYKPHMIELPFLKSYQHNGDHGLKYVASEDDISDPDDI